ncbi:lysophospholipase-like protein [Pseudovirgaria hyperparasitica]|uniref:Lysophospholipase-like protein n=1 Tax=Pseudovirgaria hyperparasitica TaxID=470096 RepID=A0A6A6W1R9_9PEZI|nr:lysophospholipase-like protein [Pseudovirgaria hyperparasitica]KAF2756495.1 lysophospholipase-like protein [Pseudovirgaria hyperparasitica]
MSTVEGSLEFEDRKLYTKTWKTDGPAKARVAFVHGYSDHCGRYGIFFPTLASNGIEVCAFDQAGWGRSVQKPSERGLTGPTSRVHADITAFLNTLIPSSVPLFLMGHSMGGGEILTYAAMGPADTRQHIRGYLAEAPLIGLDPASQPLKLVLTLGKLAAKLAPNFQRTDKLKADYISRDPENNQSIVDDPLCHDTGTLEGLAGMFERADLLESGKLRISEGRGQGGRTRMWVSHGTGDRVCSFDATKKFCDREKKDIEDFEFKVYDGWYHQLHFEPSPDRETFANDVIEWILKRTDDTTADEGVQPKL